MMAITSAHKRELMIYESMSLLISLRVNLQCFNWTLRCIGNLWNSLNINFVRSSFFMKDSLIKSSEFSSVFTYRTFLESNLKYFELQCNKAEIGINLCLRWICFFYRWNFVEPRWLTRQGISPIVFISLNYRQIRLLLKTWKGFQIKPLQSIVLC